LQVAAVFFRHRQLIYCPEGVPAALRCGTAKKTIKSYKSL
jgi:hypothetical protein